jgi:chemotaxis protein MotD
MSNVKSLGDGAGQGDLLSSVVAHGVGAGKAALRKVDKGAKAFNDVLGGVAKTVRQGTNTRPSMDDRTLQTSSLSFRDVRHRTVRAEPTDKDDADDKDPTASAVTGETADGFSSAAVPEGASDPLRMMMLAAGIRNAVDSRVTAMRQAGTPAAGATSAPAKSVGTKSPASVVASGDGPRRVHDDGGAGLAERVAHDAAAKPDTTIGPTAGATDGIRWTDSGAEPGGAVKARLDSPATAAKVEVIQQQTHFAPVTASHPLQQIGNAIVTELSAPAADALAPAAGTDLTGGLPVADAPPLRVLTIRLDPPSLGEVTVNMRLQGDNLELHLSATEHDTLSMLRQNRDVLHDLMRDSGYVADIASVQRANADTSAGTLNNQHAGQGQQGAAYDRARDGAGQTFADDRTGAQGGGHERQSARRDHQGAAPDDAAYDRGSGVYL